MLDGTESVSSSEIGSLIATYDSLDLKKDLDEATIADFVAKAAVCLSQLSDEEQKLLKMLKIDLVDPNSVLITLAHCFPRYEYRTATDGKQYSLYTYAVSVLLTALRQLVESSTLCNDKLDTSAFLKASGDVRDVLQARLIR